MAKKVKKSLERIALKWKAAFSGLWNKKTSESEENDPIYFVGCN